MGNSAQTLHTFLFADISGYSRLTEVGGDEAAAELAIRFAAEAERIAREHGAEVVKRVGDAVMLRCDCATELIKLGLRLHAGLGARTPLHVGIHTGAALERAGDWWGATVNVAARVADAAESGQLLITEATRAAAGELGDACLRGLGPAPLQEHLLPFSGLRRITGASRRAGGRHRAAAGPLSGPAALTFRPGARALARSLTSEEESPPWRAFLEVAGAGFEPATFGL
jgi:class 3 adenylate cyclase